MTGSPDRRIAGLLAILVCCSAQAQGLDERICLQVHCFDPLIDPVVPPALDGFPTMPRPFGTTTFELFQSSRPLDAAWFADLGDNGATSAAFLRGHTTLARVVPIPNSPPPPIGNLRWRGDYVPSYRLSNDAAAAWEGGATTPHPDGLHHLVALFMAGDSPSDHLAEILSLIPGDVSVVRLIEPDATQLRPGSLELAVDDDQLEPAIESLATTAPVRFVDMMGAGVLNGPATTSLHQTGEVDREAPFDMASLNRAYAHGLTGEGQIIGLADAHFRREPCHFMFGPDPGESTLPVVVPDLPDTGAAYPVTVSEPSNKVVTNYQFESSYVACPLIGIDPTCAVHGSASAGAAAGDGLPCTAWRDSPFAPLDCGSPGRGTVEHVDAFDGTAPGAQMVFQTHGDLLDATSFAVRRYEQAYATGIGGVGARVHSNSYGRGRAEVQLYSDFEEGVDTQSWRRRDQLIIHAAGNKGPDAGFKQNPGNAKNALIVGALGGPEPDLAGLGGIPTRLWTRLGAPDPYLNSSEHGPGAGFQVKPDLVAAGQVDVAGVPAQLVDPMPVGQCAWQNGSATSIAAPTVAGMAALVRQYFEQGFLPAGLPCGGSTAFNPTSALVRAVLINSARNLRDALYTADDGTGGASADRPSFGQGWGMPVLNDALFFPGDPVGSGVERTYTLVLTDTPNGLVSVADLAPTDGRLLTAAPRPAIRQDEIHEFTIRVETGEDLHVTLAWTDPPGASPSNAPLVNDLDLEVVGPHASGQVVTWRPNAGMSSVLVGEPGHDPLRAWLGGYTQLGAAPCPILMPGDPECTPDCPPGEPQYLHEQALRPTPSGPRFSCFSHRDGFNTVENVFIPATALGGGDYKLRVIGYGVEGRSVPPELVLPNLVPADGAGADLADATRQGYALLATGRVAHDRAMVHFDDATVRCGDEIRVRVNDRNLAAPAPPVGIEALDVSGLDVESVVVGADGWTAPLPATEVPTLAFAVSGDGVLQFTTGATVIAKYDDDAPFGWAPRACAHATPFVSWMPLSISSACGNEPGIQRSETLLVTVPVQNVSGRVIEMLHVEMVAPPLVTASPAVAMVGPLPLQPGEVGTARFAVVIDLLYDCSADLNVPLDLYLRQAFDGPRLPTDCAAFRSAITLSACDDDTGPDTPPGEVPNTSLRIIKSGYAGVALNWDPAAGASDYRVFRGNIGTFVSPIGPYDHGVGLSAGSCSTLTLLAYGDTEELHDEQDYYYLIGAVADCGLDGPLGTDSLGVARPAGGGCP